MRGKFNWFWFLGKRNTIKFFFLIIFFCSNRKSQLHQIEQPARGNLRQKLFCFWVKVERVFFSSLFLRNWTLHKPAVYCFTLVAAYWKCLVKPLIKIDCANNKVFFAMSPTGSVLGSLSMLWLLGRMYTVI